jgi:hypothetical protein
MIKRKVMTAGRQQRGAKRCKEEDYDAINITVISTDIIQY